ncbi:MAG TPA: hypothetical protein VER03_02925 [Bryobacteraceae bacterium]|nr:hypothetical protein [Bryobacteraceae bacterium]
MSLARIALALVSATVLVAAEKYIGPRPPKVDVPYLMHADNLVETEVGKARSEERKDVVIATIPGASSPVKTPLSEPIFIIKTDKLVVDKIQAYRLQVKNGQREVVVNAKNVKNVQRPLHLQVTKLDERLYRVEVDEALENGEYSLSPDGSDETFSFQVY